MVVTWHGAGRVSTASVTPYNRVCSEVSLALSNIAGYSKVSNWVAAPLDCAPAPQHECSRYSSAATPTSALYACRNATPQGSTMTTTPLNQGSAGLRYAGVGADGDFRRRPGLGGGPEQAGGIRQRVGADGPQEDAAEISAPERSAPPPCRAEPVAPIPLLAIFGETICSNPPVRPQQPRGINA